MTESRGKKPKFEVDWPEIAPIEPDPISLKDRLVSVGMWGLALPWLAGGTGAIYFARKFLTTDQADPLDRLYIKGQLALTGCSWTSVVHPGVDPKKQYLFFQNHVNNLDHCTMYNATPHFKQGVELAEHFKYPFYGPFMKQRGTLPVVRGSAEGLKNLIKGMRSEIERGHSILVFPEGTRTTTGRVGPFKPGVFRIALDLGVPIVPVSVTGMYDFMRKGSYVLRPGFDVTVYYDRPIPTEGLRHDDVPRLMKQVHATMSRRVDDYWRARGKLPPLPTEDASAAEAVTESTDVG